MKPIGYIGAGLVGLASIFLLYVTASSQFVSLKPESLREPSNRSPTESLEAIDFPDTKTPTPFQPFVDSPTPINSPTITRTSEPSKTSTETSTSSPSASPTATDTPTPLDKALIKEIKGRWASYPLSCESRSAVDWAAYFGVQIDEIDFFNQLPVSDDPDFGFVGDVNGPWGSTPPDSYGVHADPIADLLREYGLDAISAHGFSWDQLRAEISQGRPVIVWVVGRIGLGTPVPYTSSTGHQTTVARFEHTVIVTGYTQTEITVLDGYWTYTRLIQDFLASWSVLGNMAVVWSGD